MVDYLRVPSPAERRDDLSGDGLLAGGANALLRRPHTLLVHILTQVPQHHIKARAHRLVLLLLQLEVAERHHEVVEFLYFEDHVDSFPSREIFDH